MLLNVILTTDLLCFYGYIVKSKKIILSPKTEGFNNLLRFIQLENGRDFKYWSIGAHNFFHSSMLKVFIYPSYLFWKFAKFLSIFGFHLHISPTALLTMTDSSFFFKPETFHNYPFPEELLPCILTIKKELLLKQTHLNTTILLNTL